LSRRTHDSIVPRQSFYKSVRRCNESTVRADGLVKIAPQLRRLLNSSRSPDNPFVDLSAPLLVRMAAAWHFRRSHFSGLRGSTGGGKAAHACALLSKVEVKKLAPWPDVQRWNALMTWEGRVPAR
jgi:hypothetical protein